MVRSGTDVEVTRPLPGQDPHPAFLTAWGGAAVAVALVRNRVWATPNLHEFAAIARELGERPFGDDAGADYLMTNLGLPTLARVVGQTSPHAYARLHLIVLLVGLAACVALAYRRFGYRTARTLTVLVAAAPGVTVALQWLGQPDALTFPVGVALALVRRRAALVGLGLLLGLVHPEQGLVIALAATAARAALADPAATPAATPIAAQGHTPRRGPGWDLLAIAGGVALGRAVTEVYFRVNDLVVQRPRSELLGLGLDVFLDHHLQSPVALVVFLWGPLWLVIGAIVVSRWRRSGLEPDRDLTTGVESSNGLRWVVLAVAALVMLAPVAVTLDETRVYAMLTAPLVAAAAVLVCRDPATRALGTARAASALLVLAAVLPGGFSAGTATWAPDLPAAEMVRFLGSGEHPEPLEVWLMSPFEFVIPVSAQN